MQRGISGKTRRGAPPLTRQRRALRVVQLTLLGLAVFLGTLAIKAWREYSHPPSVEARVLEGASPAGAGEVVVLTVGAIGFGLGSLAMGVRRVRGPEPPRLR